MVAHVNTRNYICYRASWKHTPFADVRFQFHITVPYYLNFIIFRIYFPYFSQSSMNNAMSTIITHYLKAIIFIDMYVIHHVYEVCGSCARTSACKYFICINARGTISRFSQKVFRIITVELTKKSHTAYYLTRTKTYLVKYVL